MNKQHYFYGNKVSNYGCENGRVDYRCFSQAFNHVLNNNIMELLEWNVESINGFYDEENEPEIFQYYIVDENGADLIRDYTDDPLFYNYEYDIYIWGVTHYGTGWDYVLTDIPTMF